MIGIDFFNIYLRLSSGLINQTIVNKVPAFAFVVNAIRPFAFLAIQGGAEPPASG